MLWQAYARSWGLSRNIGAESDAQSIERKGVTRYEEICCDYAPTSPCR